MALLRNGATLLCVAFLPSGARAQSEVPEYDPVWGFADLHNHQFSNLGFTGELIAGDVFCGGPFTYSEAEQLYCALPCCGNSSALLGCGTDCEDDADLHGLCGVGDWIGNAAVEGDEHTPSGYPEFEGWPKWNTATHQQNYYRWLQRSWVGGQRLMVMMAVDNEVFCKAVDAYRHLYEDACDQLASISEQIEMAKQLEAYIDQADNSDLDGSGFYRIAYSAEEAREIIEAGQLAVILGVEMSNLLGCYKNECCFPEWDYTHPCDPGEGVCKDVEDVTQEDIERELDCMYELGIRHVHAVHQFDNAFGGASAFDFLMNFGNDCINGEPFDIYDCSSEGYEFTFEKDKRTGKVTRWEPLLDLILGCDEVNWDLLFESYPSGSDAAHCNARGLQMDGPGEWLIEGLMARGMIIDLDHMSLRTREDVLDIVEAECYPVVSSHSSFSGQITRGQKDHEQSRLLGLEIKSIRELGGLVAPILRQGNSCSKTGEGKEGCIDQYDEFIDNDCDFSSRTWAQAYLYAVDQMKDLQVGLGTDLGGPFEHIAPRYGGDACRQWPYDGTCADTGENCNGEWSSCPGGCEDYTSGWTVCRDSGLGYEIGAYCCPSDECVAIQDPDDEIQYPFQAHGITRLCDVGSECFTSEGCVDGICKLTKHTAGERTFDFNTSGLAHVGLLPDFIEDLKQIGVTDDELEPLFRSAEAYVGMWERIDGGAPVVYAAPDSLVADNCGAGTPENPYVSLDLALERVKAGGVIVLDGGTYEQGIEFDKELELVADGGDAIIGG